MKKFLVCLIAGAVVLSIGIVPQRILSGVTHYSVVTPTPYQYQPELRCNGVVTAEEGIKLLTSSNVIVTELRVENGSWVEAGQVVAITEPPKPEEAFLSQSINIAEGAAGLSQQELSGLAAQYGLELPATGELPTIPEDQLAAVTAAREATAPISGIITWNSVSPGRFVPAGSQLCTILSMDRYKAVVQVPAEDARLIQPGAAAILSGSEIDYQQYTGSVTSVGNTISRGMSAGGYNSTIAVEIAVEAPPDSIRHGASVSCTILTGPPEQMLTLPYEAIRQDERNREYLYLVEPGGLKKQYVQTGLELDEVIQILSGIGETSVIATGDSDDPGQKFVLDGTALANEKR